MASSSQTLALGSSSQPNDPNAGMCKYGGKCMFIWDGLSLSITLPLPPLVQTRDSCSFASVARQNQLDIIIKFAEIGHDVYVEFDHFHWETIVRRLSPETRYWEPIDLLNLVTSDHVNHIDATRCGLPLKIGDTYFPHWISKAEDYCDYIPNTDPPKPTTRPSEKMMRFWLLEKRIPLIATIPIVDGYPSCSEHPYVGINHKTMKILPYKYADDANEKYKTHSVVILGIYEPPLDNPLKLDTSIDYYIFQGSFLEHKMKKVERKNFLPCGMSIVSSQLIERVCYGVNYPPYVMVQREPPIPHVVSDMKLHLAETHDEHRKVGKIGWLWKKIMGHRSS